MSRLLKDTRSVSLKLSEVLGDIGITEKMVLKRRRIFMLMETIDTMTHGLLGEKAFAAFYNFGSQTEGSTTMELDSDIDTLMSYHNMNVIQDWSEWKFGIINVLMIQEATTSPGYCLLQVLRPEAPLAADYDIKAVLDVGLDDKGRPLLKNSCFDDFLLANQFRNGPANTHKEVPGYSAEDNVHALYSKYWPAEARPWLARQNKGRWPSEEMKRYCETTGCFLVPVGSKNGQYEKLEWRISTSLAERCLMFSLNITQIRCYVLIKMILKTLINPQCDGVLSSFMCKTVLFHCIENTQSNEWAEHNLLSCLKHCLLTLYNFITQECCPHFITPGNNLMAGKISPPVKRTLQEILQNIMQNEGSALLEIPMDDLGPRLQVKMSMIPELPSRKQPYGCCPVAIHAQISATLLMHIAKQLCMRHGFYLIAVFDEKHIGRSRLLIHTLARRYAGKTFSSLEKAAYKIIIPLLCSSLASAIASSDIRASKTISQEAHAWFSEGLNSDVSSGRLKFASALYCTGNFERTELILRDTEDIYDQDSVETVCACRDERVTVCACRDERVTVCACRDKRVAVYRLGFFNKSNTGNEELVKHLTAFCVRFIRCEINCVPRELQYEMFRSTQDDMLKRDKLTDCWMDWAVVDSLPYLYFLQYKTYGKLRRDADQIRALEKLVKCSVSGVNIMHRETAFNLIGQCLEQANLHVYALDYYLKSLRICENNNVAKIHICRVLNVLVNRWAV